MHNGLPNAVAALVGRDRERAEVGTMVAETRVVTLTGSGGCGKTRLAMAVAGDVMSRFSDGVRWVDLTGVSEPEMVAPVVGVAVGHHGRSPRMLTDELRERHLLVVLDNCEHLVSACATLASELSSACPRLHLLATTREPLAIEGEATFDVPPLDVPRIDARSAGTVATTDAARLFELRARQVRTDFVISDENAAAVARICRRLDGIPLAIELAAARVRVLTPAQIAVGLADRFGLLTGGRRDAAPRQRTLEASLDWSYEHLDGAQRLALARLSVFATSFDLDAARAVVASEGIDDGDVLDLITGLAERSWLQVGELHGTARYRLLETIRVYARRRLAELDHPERVRDRHVAFHLGLAARAHGGLVGAQPEAWMARLAADLDDLRAAMDRAATVGDHRALLGIAAPISRFWLEHGLSGEIYRRLHAAVATPGIDDADRARGFVTAALLAFGNGEPAISHGSAAQGVAASRAAGLDDTLALALSVRAWSAAVSGLASTEEVGVDVEEAVECAARCQDAANRAFALIFAGMAVIRTGAIDGARHLIEQAIEVSEVAEVTFHLPAAHACLGLWPALSGELDRTRHHARRGLELSRQLGRPAWEAVGLAGLGAADLLQGKHGRARHRLSEAREALRQRALEESAFDLTVRHWFALSAYAAGDPESARAAAVAIVRIGRERGSRWDEAVGEWLLGLLTPAEDEARAHLEHGRALATDPRLPFPLGRSSLGLAELSRVRGELEEAWELAHDGLEVLAGHGDRVGAAAALEAIADLAVSFGKPELAIRLLAASDGFHADAGLDRLPQEADRFGRACRAARAASGESDMTSCWEAGGELSLEDAVAYAHRGRGERGRPPVGWASLTPAERELVRLVAQGCTNAGIGERLFMSVNTVKKHLSHVYTKVDVQGRAGLAAEAARRDL